MNTITIGYAGSDYMIYNEYDNFTTDVCDAVEISKDVLRIMQLETAIQSAMLALEKAQTFITGQRDQMRPTMASVTLGTAQSILNNVL